MLLPAVEDGTLILIGATTENPFFAVNSPLRSRSTLFRLRAARRRRPRAARSTAGSRRGHVGTTTTPSSCSSSAPAATGARADVARGRARAGRHPDPVEARPRRGGVVDECRAYGRDDHYDVISAFIKSMRGSDPDAAVYWLARMLEAGEDARFIARRMVIFASEDVGKADPQALRRRRRRGAGGRFVGLPEAQLNLAQAVVTWRPPRRATRALAIWNARGRRRRRRRWRGAGAPAGRHYQGAKVLGHGTGYEYPHDHEGGWVDSDVPARQLAEVVVRPTDRGFEQEVTERMRQRASENRASGNRANDNRARSDNREGEESPRVNWPSSSAPCCARYVFPGWR